VKEYLAVFAVEYTENKNLVRGLDYYTRTVFEFKHELLGAQDTVLAGGRYDLLMKELGGQDAPALGWAMGVARLLLTMPEDRPPTEERPRFFAAVVGKKQLEQGRRLQNEIQSRQNICILGSPDISLKQQLKRAHRARVDYTIIVGEEEVRSKVCIVRNMETGEQQTVPLQEFTAYLANL
jgi:histidyl-tRNA synthetase